MGWTGRVHTWLWMLYYLFSFSATGGHAYAVCLALFRRNVAIVPSVLEDCSFLTLMLPYGIMVAYGPL